jgi:hypothetical protein
MIRELIASQFHALAAMRAARTFGGWDIYELPDDDDLP